MKSNYTAAQRLPPGPTVVMRWAFRDTPSALHSSGRQAVMLCLCGRAGLGSYAQVRARRQFLFVDENEHRLTRNAEHRDSEAAPRVVTVVAVRVVDDVAAGFPERLSGADDSWWLAFPVVPQGQARLRCQVGSR